MRTRTSCLFFAGLVVCLAGCDKTSDLGEDTNPGQTAGTGGVGGDSDGTGGKADAGAQSDAQAGGGHAGSAAGSGGSAGIGGSAGSAGSGGTSGSAGTGGSSSCSNTCSTDGEAECASGKIRSCTKDNQGCLAWGDYSQCSSGSCAGTTACSDCNNGCSESATECNDGRVRSCIADNQGCLNWGAWSDCSTGTCATGQACGDCNNTCPSDGASDCNDGKVRSCVKDNKGCLSWGDPSPCSSGFCSDTSACGNCTHSCPSVSASECKDGKLRTCEADNQGCRAWSVETSCSSGFCADATACGSCSNACTEVGATLCDSGSLQRCLADSHGCLSWSSPTQCELGSCENTTACASCKNQCSSAGAGKCVSGQLSACVADGHGCLTWGPSSACGSGFCADGEKCGACNDTCPSSGDSQCANGQLQTCQADGYGCLAWSIPSSCSSGFCAGTSCGACTNTCSAAGVTTCASGSLRTCEADSYGCLALGSATICADGSCADGAVCSNCADGQMNGSETDKDCGGNVCGPCALNQGCKKHGDCASKVCDFTGTHKCTDKQPSYTTDEDFETGDFKRFPYKFSSNQATAHNWAIETDASKCHAGKFCARTNLAHASSETTKLSLSLSVRHDTTMTFWAKTNTEPGQHFFRFSVDGVVKKEVSGQTDWTLYQVQIPATGAGGSDRVLTWEFARSTFVDPGHTPWYEVWLDDIDMPEWNTQPTIPQMLRPGNGMLLRNATPTFEWLSADPDYDPITYEMQYDTTPTFSQSVSTGESYKTTFTPASPLQDKKTYYWRVRAKDNSDYRWSDWSPTAAVGVDTTYEYATIWRQTLTDEFKMDAITSLEARQDSVFNITPQSSFQRTGSASGAITIKDLPPAKSGSSGTLTINKPEYADFSEYAKCRTTTWVDSTKVDDDCAFVCYASWPIPLPGIASFVSDGQISLRVDYSCPSGYSWDSYCSSSTSYTLSYTAIAPLIGNIVSTPIALESFGGSKFWEKVQFVGTGDITLQVLDEAGHLIPDSMIPGNATGTKVRTLRLWGLDPAQYPVIRIKATVGVDAELQEWSVAANDMHEWLFSHGGDQEGWVGKDHSATPTVTVQNGVLRLASTASGDDPHIEYWFPQPVDAARFSTLEVRLRASNIYQTNDPTLFWDSNYGAFDSRRSFTLGGQVLIQLTDISFDLNQLPVVPNEPWQGKINAIRLDPVARFLSQTGQPADGWFEIDRIAVK